MVLKKHHQQGFLLLELLLIMALVTLITASAGFFIAFDRESLSRGEQRQTATTLADQQIERVKSIASSDWGLLVNGDWHLVLIGGSWWLVAGEQNDDGMIKKITIGPVYRLADGTVTDQNGLLDPSSKKITSAIAWNDGTDRSLSSQIILTNYVHHQVWNEDTLADFQDGLENATDFASNPGFVQIAQTGGGGWTQPRSLGTVDGERKSSGICTNREYLYLAQNSTIGGIEVFDIRTTPELPVSNGSFTITYKPNDCTTSSGYLYLANDFFLIPSVSIYNIGANPIDPPFVNNLLTIFATKSLAADDHYLFASINNSNIIRAYRLDQDHYTNPQLMGYFSTTRNIVSLALSGNYLYVAQDDTGQAIKIYNIAANPANPTDVGTVTLLYTPMGIGVDSNILYVSMDNKTGAMLSLDNPTAPNLYGYFPTVRNSADVAAYGDFGYVAGQDSQLKVIEVFDLSDSKGLSGIYFIYGEYFSSTLNLADSSSFYRLDWVGSTPIGTETRFQVAINNDNLTWNYIGPDGTSQTFFESPGIFYFPSSIGQYFKYKIILTGDGNQTPVVDKVTVSYAD